jgi:cytochrome c biogenesis protein CcmG, thiol:disulfide interchange protein DsbE
MLVKYAGGRHRHNMNHKAGIMAALLAAALSVSAEVKLSVLRVDGEVYTNVTVFSKSATDIYFTHARGMGNAKLKHLAPDLQAQFGYDPIKAGETAKKQAEANAAYRLEIRNAKPPTPARAESPAAEPADIRAPKVHARSFRDGPAPNLVVEKWLTAKPNYTGKFLLIDFWATWCGPCRRSIPELNALQARFGDRLVIVGLSDETEQEVREMKSPKIDYSVAIDTAATTKRAVEVRGIPHAILIDPKGIVRFEGHPGYLSADGVAGLLAKYSP